MNRNPLLGPRSSSNLHNNVWSALSLLIPESQALKFIFPCLLINRIQLSYWGLPPEYADSSDSKESACNAGQLSSIPWFLPAKSQGQRSLVSHNPWCHKESGTTEWLWLFTITQNLFVYAFPLPEGSLSTELSFFFHKPHKPYKHNEGFPSSKWKEIPIKQVIL